MYAICSTAGIFKRQGLKPPCSGIDVQETTNT